MAPPVRKCFLYAPSIVYIMNSTNIYPKILASILLVLALITSVVVVALPASADSGRSCSVNVRDYWDDAGHWYATARFQCTNFQPGDKIAVSDYSSGKVYASGTADGSGTASGSWQPPVGANHIEFNGAGYWREFSFSNNPQPDLPTTTTTTTPPATTTTQAPAVTTTTVPPVTVTTTTRAPSGGSVTTTTKPDSPASSATTTTSAAPAAVAAPQDVSQTMPSALADMYLAASDAGYAIVLDYVWTTQEYGTILKTQGPSDGVLILTITSGRFIDNGVPIAPDSIPDTTFGFALMPRTVAGETLVFFEVVEYGERVIGYNVIW